MTEGYEIVPTFSKVVLHPYGWILFCPIPWLIYAAYLSRARELNWKKAFTFAGAAVLMGMLLFGAVVAAGLLPLLPRCVSDTGGQ